MWDEKQKRHRSFNEWTNHCWPIISQTAWEHRSLDWSRWPEGCGKSQDAAERARGALPALAVMVDASGSACSCHGSFGSTFVLMPTNGAASVPASHPTFAHACLHTHSLTHFAVLISPPVSFSRGLSSLCCDRRAETIYHTDTQLDGHGPAFLFALPLLVSWRAHVIMVY